MRTSALQQTKELIIIVNSSLELSDPLVKATWDSAELGGYLSHLQLPDKWPSDDDVRRALARCGDASV